MVQNITIEASAANKGRTHKSMSNKDAATTPQRLHRPAPPPDAHKHHPQNQSKQLQTTPQRQTDPDNSTKTV
jgi:hypothetical protein